MTASATPRTKPRTGARDARAPLVIRLLRMAAGFAVVAAGIALLVLPGPGLVVVVSGLAILARDLDWARRACARLYAKVPKDANGRPRRLVTGAGIAIAAASIGASAVFLFA